MDTNKKAGREERVLVRMAAGTREALGFGNKQIELWTSDSTKDRLTVTQKLSPFKAYAEDIAKVNTLVADGKISPEDKLCVLFVTSAIYNKFSKFKNVWGAVTVEDTVIGADPEFILMAEGKVYNAAMINGFTKTSVIGSDGPLAEMRPDPALSPEELVANLKHILTSEASLKSINKYDWIATAYIEDAHRDYPVGSHIHFGNPASISLLTADKRKLLFRVITKVLDELLALPLIKFDGEEGSHRRIRCKMSIHGGWGVKYALGYGYFGDIRITPEPNGRLEYRTLSGKIMASPEILTMVYGVAKMIVDSVFSTLIDQYGTEVSAFTSPEAEGKDVFNDNFDKWDTIKLAQTLNCVMPSKDLRSRLHLGTPVLISRRFLEGWLDKMKGLPKYNEGSVYVQELFTFLNRKTTVLKSIETNMKKTWL